MTRQQEAAKTGGLRGPGGGRLSKLGRPLARRLPGGIRGRLFLLIALAAVPVLILQGWLYYQRHDARRDQALQTEVEVAQGIATTFSAYIDGLHRQLDAIGQAILTSSPYTDAKVQRILDDAVARHPSVRSMNWVSPEGRILVSSLADGVGADLSIRPYFQQIQAGQSWAIGDLTEHGAVLENPTVAMGAAVRDDDGRLLGVVVASIEPTRLSELTFPYRRRAGGVYTIIDSQGQLVYRSPSVPLTWEDRVRWRRADPLLQGALEGQITKGVIISPVAKHRVIAARVPIPGTGWVAGAARAVDIAMGPVWRALFQDAMLGLVVASLALLLAAILARTIAEPLRRLEHDAQAMGAGVIEAPDDLQAPTEVQSLRGSVSAMAAGLIDRAEALRQANEQLQEQTEELQAQAEELQAQAEELRATNEALEGREREYRTLAENTPEVIARFDRQLRHTYINEYGAKVYGVSQRAVIGKTSTDLGMPADKVAFWKERFEQVLADGRQQTVDFEFDSPAFGHQYLSSLFVPEFDARGEVASILAITRDITAVKQAEQVLRDLAATLESEVARRTAELEHRARQLQKLTLELSQTEDRERRHLADILHDDLQQQLAAVKFHVGLMSGRVRGDASLQRVVSQLDKMLTDAIETSRSLSHELSPAMLYQGNLGETFEWLANQIRTKHGLNVRARTDGEVSLQSDALKAFLFKAVQELLFNVVKHARVGEAGVRVRRSGPYVCVVVSDRGRGFDPQDLKAAAGFGLFSIRERVQLLGGRMRIRSARGKGSTFFIAVPDNRKTEDGGQRTEDRLDLSSVLRPAPSGPVLRVLVADDHEVVRQGLASLLREEPDIEVVGEAANGREAVDMASRLRPDVVIMDVAMPLMNGDEATRQTKQHLPGIRVIALSMYAEDNMVERMRRAGAECYILKTAPADELLATIRGKKACA